MLDPGRCISPRWRRELSGFVPASIRVLFSFPTPTSYTFSITQTMADPAQRRTNWRFYWIREDGDLRSERRLDRLEELLCVVDTVLLSSLLLICVFDWVFDNGDDLVDGCDDVHYDQRPVRLCRSPC